MMHDHDRIVDIVQVMALNLASAGWTVMHLNWWRLLPDPEHFVQWMISVGVGVSVMALNVVKTSDALRHRRERKRREEDE